MEERGIEHSCEIVVKGPPAHVFAVLIDLEQYLAQWARGPVAAKKVTSGPTTNGTRFEVTARVAGIRVRAPYTVTSFGRDQRFAGQGIAGPVRFSEEYTLQPDRDAADRRSAPPAARLRPPAVQGAPRDHTTI